MLKRLLGTLFTLAALATFVWVALGSYTSWGSDGEEVVVDKTLPVPADTAVAAAAATDAAPAPAASSPAAGAVDQTAAVPAAPAAAADSLASPAADTVR